MKPYLTKFILLFIIPLATLSQNNTKIDSLLNALNNQPDNIERVNTSHELFHVYKDKNPSESLKYIDLGLKLSKKINYQTGEGLNYLNLAYYFRFIPQVDSARFYFKKSIKTLKSINDKKNLWAALNQYAVFETLRGKFDVAQNLSNEGINVAKQLKNGLLIVDNLQRKSTISMDIGDFKAAMEYALKASKVLDTITPKNNLRLGIVKADIGRIEMLRGNYADAIKPLNNAYRLFIKVNNNHWQATILMEIGNLNWYMEDYDEAKKNYGKSIEICRNMGRKDLVAMNFANIGLIHSSKGEYEQAIKYLLEVQKINQNIESKFNSAINYNNLATAYFGNKDYKNAVEYHTKGIKLAKSINALDMLRDGYFGRSRAYEKTKNYLEALNDQREYQVLNDSIFNETTAKQIDELKTKYETEKKEQQILLQKNEIELLKQKGEIDNLYKILFGIGFLLSLIGFYAVRQKLKRSKIEREKLDLELDFKKKELTTHALHLAKKNEVLESLKQQAQTFKNSENNIKGYNQLIRTINFDLKDDNNWKNFSKYFEEVHKNFNSNVKQQYPDVTSNELRLMALIKMNLSSKEIANILNISHEGIKKARYRLRKKLGITTEDSLQDLIFSL